MDGEQILILKWKQNFSPRETWILYYHLNTKRKQKERKISHHIWYGKKLYWKAGETETIWAEKSVFVKASGNWTCTAVG